MLQRQCTIVHSRRRIVDAGMAGKEVRTMLSRSTLAFGLALFHLANVSAILGLHFSDWLYGTDTTQFRVVMLLIGLALLPLPSLLKRLQR